VSIGEHLTELRLQQCRLKASHLSFLRHECFGATKEQLDIEFATTEREIEAILRDLGRTK
jgi:hypothetical protein